MGNVIAEGYLIRVDGYYHWPNTGIYTTKRTAQHFIDQMRALYQKKGWGSKWEDAVPVKVNLVLQEGEKE